VMREGSAREQGEADEKSHQTCQSHVSPPLPSVRRQQARF